MALFIKVYTPSVQNQVDIMKTLLSLTPFDWNYKINYVVDGFYEAISFVTSQDSH